MELRVLAQLVCEWNGTALAVVRNSGFKAPVDLSAASGHQVGDVACVPDDVVGDFDKNLVTYVVQNAGTISPLTYNGASPPTRAFINQAYGTMKEPSASPFDSDEKHWIQVEGNITTVDNTGSVVATSVPARVPFSLTVFAYPGPSSAPLAHPSALPLTAPP